MSGGSQGYLAKITATAKELGYVRMESRGGHLKFRHPETGETVTVPSTPHGGWRTLQNNLTQLRIGAGQSNQGRPAVVGERRRRVVKPRESVEGATLSVAARVRQREKELKDIEHLMYNPKRR